MPSKQRTSSESAVAWADIVKGLALIWIFCNHVSERIFGAPYMANPSTSWPPLHERIAQLAPIGHGLSGAAANLIRYVGWTGDQGVGLFIVVSGFLLTLGVLKRPLNVQQFFSRRLLRIYPLWIAVHLTFIAVWFAIGKGLDPTDPRTLASIAGLRFIPEVFYYFSPAWWYVGLALQLYLVFPVLCRLMQRYGALQFTVWCVVAGCAARAIGLYTFGSFVDEWSRGGVFITRLPEFALGMGLAAAWVSDPERFMRTLRSPALILTAIAAWFAGNALSLTLWGMSVAPVILTASSLALAIASADAVFTRVRTFASSLSWTGKHSYSLYLTHQVLVAILVGGAAASTTRHIEGVLAAILATLALSIALEWVTGRAENAFARLSSRHGARRVAATAAAVLFGCYSVLLAGEGIVRAKAPLEVDGWGERVSLQPDSQVGWKLRPGETHRLRWTSYDYTVTANELGFPGPLFTGNRPHGTIRIMTLGDAFTSAEGVNTDESWPRRLQVILSSDGAGAVQVQNFGITGYGPNQYAAVTREYAPSVHPNLIVIGMFVNDLEDALRTNASFQSDIGFEKQPPGGAASILELQQLKQYWAVRVRAPMIAALRRQPDPEGAFLGNIRFLDRTMEPRWLEGAQITKTRYAEIEQIARANGAKVAIALFPASVQVCGAESLKYYPKHFNPQNTARWDPDFPQRTAAGIASSLRIPFDDLRPALRAAPQCPYQPRNMHLTAYGQNVAAQAIAAFLQREALVPRAKEPRLGERAP